MFIEELYDKFSVSTGINTDTHTIEFDQFFVALKGANFNGNQYADEALSKGAIFALVDEEKYVTTEQHILVEDCLKTLQDLARFHRNMLGVPITGSNGKTTTKELIQAVLSTTYNTFATKGNLNNHSVFDVIWENDRLRKSMFGDVEFSDLFNKTKSKGEFSKSIDNLENQLFKMYLKQPNNNV